MGMALFLSARMVFTSTVEKRVVHIVSRWCVNPLRMARASTSCISQIGTLGRAQQWSHRCFVASVPRLTGDMVATFTFAMGTSCWDTKLAWPRGLATRLAVLMLCPPEHLRVVELEALRTLCRSTLGRQRLLRLQLERQQELVTCTKKKMSE